MPDQTHRGQVLIVEDERSLRGLYREALECLEVDLYEAPDGAAAARMVEIFRPDVIVTDIEMPRMDGFELCRLVRGNGADRPAEVIAITADVSPEMVAKIMECGARACLSKPLSMDVLVSEVEAALAARHGA